MTYDPTGPGTPAWDASEEMVEAGKRLRAELAAHGKEADLDAWLASITTQIKED